MAYPELYSFAQNRVLNLQKAAHMEELINMFQLPLSIEAFDQFKALQQDMQDIQLHQVKDNWFYSWGNNCFSAAKAYKHMIGHTQVHSSTHWIGRHIIK